MTSKTLSTTVEERILTAEADDRVCQDAESRFYAATAKLDDIDKELFRELDAAWVDCLDAIRRVAWLDGFACGRDPLALATFAAKGPLQ